MAKKLTINLSSKKDAASPGFVRTEHRVCPVTSYYSCAGMLKPEAGFESIAPRVFKYGPDNDSMVRWFSLTLAEDPNGGYEAIEIYNHGCFGRDSYILHVEDNEVIDCYMIDTDTARDLCLLLASKYGQLETMHEHPVSRVHGSLTAFQDVFNRAKHAS